MKTSKILININDLSEMPKYEKIGINNFLFAVKDYSIGYNSFAIEDIPKDAYLLINRVMDTKAITSLNNIKNSLKKFKGIIFEDLGVYHILKDLNIPLIWFQNHFTTNTSSINYWLDSGCLSAIISNELTEDEIINILSNSHKPLILNIFGKNQIMYSRRKLLSNFNMYNDLGDYNRMCLKENNTNHEFLAVEEDYGTVLFNNTYFNYQKLLPKISDDSVLFYYINNIDLTVEEIRDFVNGKAIGDDGFLNKKTVYKMSEYTDKLR